MTTLYRRALSPAQKPYRIELSFTQEGGDFGAVSVTERSCPVSILKVDHHILDRAGLLEAGLR